MLKTGLDDTSLLLFHTAQLARRCARTARILYLLSDQGGLEIGSMRPPPVLTWRETADPATAPVGVLDSLVGRGK